MSQTIQNSDESQLTIELVENIVNYYKKINSLDGKQDINSQYCKIDAATVYFKNICIFMDQLTMEHEELLNQYQNLEQQLIQKEAETRRHIQIEQQLKLYAESLLENSEESQKQLDNLNTQIINISKENINLKQQIRRSKNERVQTDFSKDKLVTLISQQKSLLNEIPSKNLNKRSLESQKFRILQTQNNDRQQMISNIYLKKQSLQIKQRSNTIHVTDCQSKFQKIQKQRNNF